MQGRREEAVIDMGICWAGSGVLFGSGSHDNSVCPSLACLDIKLYNFLNSEACICTTQDLRSIRELSTAAQGHLNTTLIGDPLTPHMSIPALAILVVSDRIAPQRSSLTHITSPPLLQSRLPRTRRRSKD